MDSVPADGFSIAEILQKLAQTTNPTGNNELIDLVIHYLKIHKQDHTRFDAVRWIGNMKQTKASAFQIENQKFIQENSKLVLKSQKELQNLGLISFLNRYSIPLKTARFYLKELKVFKKDVKKDFTVLGFRNDEGGFEIRSPFIKGCVGQKSVSFIRGTKVSPKSIHLFKSFWDFLSLLSHLNATALSVDCIIINAFSCIEQTYPYIQNYGYTTAYTWMDNYIVGEQATNLFAEFFNTKSGLKHIPMNKFYSPYLDVSRWHQQQILNEQ